ncbi:ER lumen protein-retaining receptor-like [Pempheris klunzingeri]|uniref:ER lumen protein-retaining receptor-like n=1 Tax=Pempheris klunzingeri TaxID=3127111 RepID=UPI00397EC5CB
MNIFRLAGDLSHLIAIILLLWKIWKSRSCSGISGRSQLLFLVVFLCRYIDVLLMFYSLYNTVMKILYVLFLSLTNYLIFKKYVVTYDRIHDVFPYSYLIIPSIVVTLIYPASYKLVDLLWSFSIYLESVAILPQLMMITRTGEAETITGHYLFALGSYRALYILNWIYRYYSEKHFDIISVIAGLVQTILYGDFFYLYIVNVLNGKKLTLPA